MIVYIETNFLLELAYLQERCDSCEDILQLDEHRPRNRFSLTCRSEGSVSRVLSVNSTNCGRLDSMSSNLSADYATLASYLDEYRRFNEVFIRRRKSSRRFTQIFRRLRLLFSEADILTGRQSEALVAARIATFATEGEKAHEFYSAVAAEYPVHALSDLVLERFPDLEFAKLLRLQKLREQSLDRLNIPKIWGAVFGFGIILFSRIPKEVVQRHFVNYTTYLDLVFYAMLIVLVYLFLILFPMWIVLARAKERAQGVRTVLEYTAIRVDTASRIDH